MQAVVAAGGYGTRLYPLTASKPKHVLPILDGTVLGKLVSDLASFGVDEVIVTLSYHPEHVIRALSGIKRPTVLYSFEAEPRGTAGGVREILGVLEDRFLFLNGDIYHNLDLRELIEFHEESGALATMALRETDRPWEYGIVRISADGRVLAFQEKPGKGEEFSNLINAGIYVLEREAIEKFVEPGVFTDFSKHVFPRILKTGRLYALLLEGDWIDVGRPSDLLRANFMELRRRGLRRFVASGARIDRGCREPGDGRGRGWEGLPGQTLDPGRGLQGCPRLDRGQLRAGGWLLFRGDGGEFQDNVSIDGHPSPGEKRVDRADPREIRRGLPVGRIERDWPSLTIDADAGGNFGDHLREVGRRRGFPFHFFMGMMQRNTKSSVLGFLYQ